MYPSHGGWILGLALLAVAPAALAQREPHIGYVYPAGGQQGTTFGVEVAGQYLNNATNVYVSGSGVHARVIEHEPPLTPKQAGELRERLQELRKNEKDAAVIREIVEIRKKLAAFQKRRINPAIADIVPVQVTIAPNASPGTRELRLGTPTGLSNPLVFQISQLPEVRKPEPKPDEDPPPKPPIKNARAGNQPPAKPTGPLPVFTIPAVVNGQILPGGVDRYRFTAQRGQQLVVAVSARELIPYLADAVPGWFQATLALYDGQGKELAYDNRYQFHPDPVLFYTIPKEGEYLLEIKDALYRGREDFVYRIVIGELPYVTSIFPLGGRTGDRPTIEIHGWNLPLSQLTLDLKETGTGTYPVFVRNKGQVSNTMPFLVDTLPECLEQGRHNTLTNAQTVTMPIIINGRIDSPGEVDVYRFTGRAGQPIVAEVDARRLDSPLDSVLKLTDATGKQLAFNDDFEDKGSGLNTHHADSYLTAILPADGIYYLHLWDAQRQGGLSYAYRLRLSPPRPDFELRSVPASVSARVGGTVPITVLALRRDGFTNVIAITLKDAPAGFKLSGGSVQATQEQVRLTLTVPALATKEPANLKLEGRAMIQGREIVHPAVPAEDMMQAFAYRHLVTVQEQKVFVAGRGMPPAAERILSPLPVRIPAGGTARVRVSTPTATPAGTVQFELSEPPPGITIKSVMPSTEGTEIMLQSDPAKIKPGVKGNLIVKILLLRTGPDKDKPPVNRPRTTLGSLPAIPFEIVEK